MSGLINEINKHAISLGYISWISIKYLHDECEKGFVGVWEKAPEELRNDARIAFDEYKEREIKEIERRIKFSGVPSKFFSKRDEGIYNTISTATKSSKFIAIIGSPAIGKTHYGCLFCVESSVRNEHVRYISAKFLQEKCESNSFKDEDTTYLDWAVEHNFLVIDDLGREHAKFRNYVESIIDDRLDNDRKTILITESKELVKYNKINAWINKKFISSIMLD